MNLHTKKDLTGKWAKSKNFSVPSREEQYYFFLVAKKRKISYNNIVDWEAYRSGHNEPHSKCGCPPGHVGSNPTASAKKDVSSAELGIHFFYY
jgi:hypothetical protein